MWLTNQETRRETLNEQQLAGLGIDWAQGRQGDRSRGQSLNRQVKEVDLHKESRGTAWPRDSVLPDTGTADPLPTADPIPHLSTDTQAAPAGRWLIRRRTARPLP
ncbi:hypothetical protein ACWCPS_18710 [Streptomyces mauvecolor]